MNKPEASNNCKQTPMFFAAVVKDAQAAFQMLEAMGKAGCNLAYKDTLQQTALYYLARDGKLDCIKLFVSHGVSV